MAFDLSSRSRLTAKSAIHFTGDTLFDRIGRVVCAAEVLPRKELFESWEMARRVRRHFRGGRIIDLAAGHGLLAQLLLLLDDNSPRAIAVDRRRTDSAMPLWGALAQAWPRLAGRSEYIEARLDRPLPFPLAPGDLVVSAHACGVLTDHTLDLALGARARVAVLPCCQSIGRQDAGNLIGWMDAALAIDVMRAGRLRAAGYKVRTLAIPASITPKNRLLLGEPPAS